jgi:ATP-dependent protease ClpP protease subunit
MDRNLEPHLLRLESDRAVLRLLVPVDRESVFALADELELLQSYYRYRHVVLEIDSPGGEATALQFLIGRLSHWRDTQGLVISTWALSSVSSAAAIILSLGSRGYRRAPAVACLLYHSARAVMSGGGSLTGPGVRALSYELERLDHTIVSQLAQNAYPFNGEPLLIRIPEGRREPHVERTVRSAVELEAIYSAFFERDQVISPEQAVGLGLLDEVVNVAPAKGGIQ